MTPESQGASNAPSDKELNFRALEQKFNNRLQEIEAEKEKLRQHIEQLSQKQDPQEEDEDEPYIDKKKLNKTMQAYGKSTESQITKAMDYAKQAAKEELRQELWLEQNPDFFDTMKLAEKFAQKAPHLAQTILKMPEGFERNKLVYQNIKALGIDQPEQKQSSIQDKINANKRSPYYQPSGVPAPGYSQVGDFSATGQKSAYEKMQELKKTLRI
jgi:hypothetical protein